MNIRLNPRLWRYLFGAVILGFFLYFLYLVLPVLPPFIAAIVLAYVLNPSVRRLQQKRFSRTQAILLVYLSLGLTIVLLSLYVFPALLKQLSSFGDQLPRYLGNVQEIVRDFGRDYQRVELPESLRQAVNDALKEAEQGITEAVRNLIQAGIGLITGTLGFLVITPILTFYILKDLRRLEIKALHLLPRADRQEALKLWRGVDRIMVGFVQGHLMVAAVVGILSGVGLKLIGLDYALLLGIIAGIAELIPYFGPVIGAVPAVALALLHSPRQALLVVIVMVVVQQIEANILSPKILGQSVELHPVVIVFALLSGGYLYGIVGLLLAVPAAAILRLLGNFIYDRLSEKGP